MSAFGGLVLTNRGLMVQTKAQANKTLKFTRIAIGDGELSGSILEMNALVNQTLSIPISRLKVLEQGKAEVAGTLSNQSISQGFYWREIGIFAQDPDTQEEVLYCYGNARTNADYIPAGGGADVIEKTISITILVGSASNISAVINQSLIYETIEGSQEKADAAVVEAKKYTDEKVGEVDFSTLATKEEVTSYKNDYVLHPAVATTTNSGNAYVVTLDPAPLAYVNGMGLILTINADSTGAVTIDVNGLGAIPIKKANGNAVANFKKNGIYTLRYSSVQSAFILQGEGASGNATASDLLSGKTASTDAGDIVGTLPSRVGSSLVISPSYSNKIIPIGYYDGTVTSGMVKGMSLEAGSSILYSDADGGSNSSTTYTSVVAVSINASGTIRISFDLKSTSTAYYISAYARIYINGSPVGTERIVAGNKGTITFTEDIEVTSGQKIQVYAKSSSSGYGSSVKNFKIGTKINYVKVTKY